MACFLFAYKPIAAQDTFSIVAVDTVTGEVGSAGASCVDLILFFPTYATDFLGDLIPGVGAINTQASYNTTNQSNARARMLAGDTPQQIISWLQANDAQGNGGSNRQYGIAALNTGSALAAGFTGSNTLSYKNHLAGPTYCIQGNILLGQSVLDSMEARFHAAQGDLSCKLMAALQGANVVGADTRCASNGSSSLFAFLKVAQPGDSIGQPSFLISVKTPGGAGIEPIDSLQILFDAQKSCTTTGMNTLESATWNVYPNPAGDYVIVAGNASGFVRASYRVLDTEGRLVLEGLLHSDTNRIDLSTLKPGVYTLQLPGGGQQKVVRQAF
ncbi:MAG: DUF1028 domain-containing protein [Bacteroidota bacterium]